MKKIIKFLFLILVLLSFKSFAQTADIKEGCVPLQVTFEAPAGSPTYYWDFKDGVTSVQQNPKNIFTRPGTYKVTVQEAPGGPVLGTVQIVVYDDPDVSVTVSTGCAPFNGAFQQNVVKNPAIKIKTYNWIFGDGDNTDGLDKTGPTHLYNVPGEYKGSLEVVMEQASCTRSGYFTTTVLTPPVASFTTTPPSLSSCDDQLNVAYHNISIGEKPFTYSWAMGNGISSTLATPPSQVFEKGQYVTRLDVSYTNIPGCFSSVSKGISVGKPNPVIITKKDSVCGIDRYGRIDTAYFRTTTPGLYSWTIDNGAALIFPTANTDHIAVNFLTRGEHTITLTVTSFDGQCSGTTTKRIFVDRMTVEPTLTPLITCSNPIVVQYDVKTIPTTVSYRWNFDDGGTSTLAKGNKTFKMTPFYYDINIPTLQGANVLVTSKFTGCMLEQNATMTIAMPNARFMPDKTKGCGPLTVAFSDSSTSLSQYPIVKWEWLFGDGTKQVLTTKPMPTNHVYANPGEYNVKLVVTTSQGCIDTSYHVRIEVGKTFPSDINFTSDKSSVCPGEQVTFTSQISAAALLLIDAYHYTTEDNRSFHCTSERNLSWTYDNVVGPQTVTLTADYNGCYTPLTKTNFITVKGAVAKIDYTSLCTDPLNYSFKDKSLGATSLTWNFGDATSSNATDIAHTYTSGDYTVTLTALNASSGCSATTDSRLIHARKVKAKITMDTLLCKEVARSFSAVNSVDVGAGCYTGYTWQFPGSNLRPVTTDRSSADIVIMQAGRYDVLLIVKDINGCKDTAKTKIKVFEIKPDLVSQKTAICIPNTNFFTDNSISDTTIASREWRYGDGNIVTTSNKIISHPYTTIPSGPNPSDPFYTVILKVTDKLGCNTADTFYLNYYKPVSTINSSKIGLCLGDPVTLSAPDYTSQGSNLSFKWDFGNNTTGTSSPNIITYSEAKSYTVKLIYTEALTGCKDSSTIDLNVQKYPKAIIYTPYIDTMKYLCAPLNVYFRDSSKSDYPLSYYWDFDDGRTSDKKDYSLFYPKGNYSPKLTISTSNGCMDVAKKDLITVVSPEGNFIMDTDTICKGEEIFFQIIDTVDVTSWRWAFGDGIVLNDSGKTLHRYRLHPVTGKTEARLLIRGFEDRCTITQEQPVWIHRVIADFERENGDTSICFNDGPYHFRNTSIAANNYIWNFGDGTPDRTETDQVHQFPTPGIYDVKLMISDNTYHCKDTIIKKAVVYKNPVVTVKGDTAVCSKQTLSMAVIDPVASSTYEWTPSTYLGGNNTLTSYQNITVEHTTRYQIVETDTNVCKGYTYAKAIIVEPIKMRNLDTSIVIGDIAPLPVYASPQSIYTFSWNRTDSLSCLQCSAPSLYARPLQDRLYILVVTDTLGCRSDTGRFNIVIRPETFVKFPTMFTPNGDGVNDKIYVVGWGIKEMLEFIVLNRWGQVIYKSTDQNDGWDGKFNGTLQNNDTYVYKVRVITWRDEEISEEGHFTLLR